MKNMLPCKLHSKKHYKEGKQCCAEGKSKLSVDITDEQMMANTSKKWTLLSVNTCGLVNSRTKVMLSM